MNDKLLEQLQSQSKLRHSVIVVKPVKIKKPKKSKKKPKPKSHTPNPVVIYEPKPIILPVQQKNRLIDGKDIHYYRRIVLRTFRFWEFKK